MSNKDLYGKIPNITDTIREQRLRFSGHCWSSKNEVVNDVLLWLPIHGRISRGRPAKTFVDPLMEDTTFLQLRRATKRNNESRGMESTCQSMPSKIDLVR